LNERAFDEWILLGDNLRQYHQKTRENIQQLMSWVRGIEQALPVEAVRLWSEGEENFEARLDEILAVR
jgi:tRNA A37 methylthiotransferase MiaB